jgi:alanine-glyoxylate transaminase/serine-glyoxylate transaminase/serine-pyruvate transaminase
MDLVHAYRFWINPNPCSESHVGQPFVNTFSQVLSNLRKLFQTTDPASQPFVISGSGTLGWDQVAANLAEPGDDVLVLHTGYFADSFADCFETYGVKATQLKAPIGERPQLDEIEAALKEKKYKILTVTHVDTSTGVLSEIKALSELVHRVSPETLVVVDGVCSVGSEEIRFDDWKLDVVLTASQKGIGCPAGLSILMVSGRAIETFKARKTRPTSYFGSWKNWLPSMCCLLFLRCHANAYSHAKLRSKEAILLRHAVAPARPCSRYLP